MILPIRASYSREGLFVYSKGMSWIL